MGQSREVIESGNLIFTSSTMPGIYRKGIPGNFYYVNKDGERVKNPGELNRIKKLTIPPAWKEVWISPRTKGHLQAVGIDKAGRRQYLYHSEWISKRNDHKYTRLIKFGNALVNARKQIRKDLKRKELDEQKVLAISLAVMQKTLIRIGNEFYKNNYGTYGLSTLKDQHFKSEGAKGILSFTGKKGIRHELVLADKNLARLIKKCKEIPGQELFQYYTTGKSHRAIDSGMINNYIKEIMQDNFTAKDFRTWGGTLEAYRQLAACAVETPSLPADKAILQVVSCVAKKLGNTPSVCKKSYIYPALLEAYQQGKWQNYIKRAKQSKARQNPLLLPDESNLLQLLKQFKRKTAK